MRALTAVAGSCGSRTSTGPRSIAGADALILSQLAACGLLPDEPPVWQSAREPLYESALQRLLAAGWAYPCACTRRDLAEAAALRGAQRSRHGELVYPGTCRRGLCGVPRGRPASSRRRRPTDSTCH
jgi:glutamyl-Q tRNA(Asp) synthetase